MESSDVEFESNDGAHNDEEEEKDCDLEERNHRFHDGLQHNLKT